MEWARQFDDANALLVALQAVITASTDPARILAAGRELEGLAEGRGDVWNQAYGCANQGRARIALGDLDGAARDLARLRVVSAVGRISMFEVMTFHLDVMLALAAGDLDRADVVAEEAMNRAAAAQLGEGIYGVQLFAIRRAQGRLAEVTPVLSTLDRLPDRAGVWRPGLAAVYAELGMRDQAAAVFDELAPDSFGAVPRDAMWPACLTYLAETCIALGDCEAAAVLAAELEAYAGTNLTVAFTICFGPADRLLGDLLDLCGRHDEADRAFAAALALAERSGSPLWKAEVLFDRAAVLDARGQPAAAAASRAEAEAVAATIGLVWRRVRGGPSPTEPTERPPLPAGLSEREAEVLRLVAAGLSNRQIGERLFISQNTAANHVRAILRKTGCTNRTEAATYAHHAGLVEPELRPS